LRRHGPHRHSSPRGALRARTRRAERRVQGPSRREAAGPAVERGARFPGASIDGGMRVLAAVALLALAPAALAGAQRYEPLADSVRQRLSTLVTDRAPATVHFRSPSDA